MEKPWSSLAVHNTTKQRLDESLTQEDKRSLSKGLFIINFLAKYVVFITVFIGESSVTNKLRVPYISNFCY